MSIKLIRKSSDMNSNNVACFGDCPKPKKPKPSQDEDYISLPNWAHLPAVVLHEIFDLLDKEDRQNAASVCKNWRQNVFHPKWWPSVTFKIEPCNTSRAKFCISVFGKIATNATVKLNTLAPDCMDEFINLVEALSENNNIKELIIEPTHCHFDMSRYHCRSSYDIPNVIQTLMKCLPNLVKFSIGCVEDFAHYLEEYLTNLASKQSKKVTLLGLASVKDNPNEYEAAYFDCDLIKPFTNLKILSIDFDQLSDRFLRCLEDSNNLERLIVHLHGIRDGHSGTTDAAWREFKEKHPQCELRLTIIHSYDEIGTLENTVLKAEMPLTHLKVFFCENININALDFLSHFAATLRSVTWVDSLSSTKRSWSLMTSRYDSPDPLVMMSWLCKNLEELVLYGYKYCEENLIAIARLRGDKLKKLEVAEDDILVSNNEYSSRENFLVDVPLAIKKSWAPVKTADLHPVVRHPTAGDSDEYLLPIVLADLH